MQDSPRLSVVIPTFNRAATVAKCLDALAAQTYPAAAFEVLVSDDGSTDATRATVAPYTAGGRLCVRYLHQDNAGANRARNRAIRAARGRIVLLINDDSIATPPMLERHMAAHEQHPDDAVAVLGRVTVAPDLPPSLFARLHLDSSFARLAEGEHDWRRFYTCNVSAKRALLERGGLFEERIRYHEDLELGERLSRLGLRVLYRPDALAYHDHYLTEQELFAIARREGKALAVWSLIAPHLASTLADLGFDPAAPLRVRLGHALIDALINRRTLPAWRRLARACAPRSERVALRLYGELYRCERRAAIRAELAAPTGVAPPKPSAAV